MRADKITADSVESVDVYMMYPFQRRIGIKHVFQAAVPDEVHIFLALCRIARMEIIVRKPCPVNRDVVGQQPAYRIRQPVAGNVSLAVEMAYVGVCVNARVGTAAPRELHVVLKHRFDGILHGFLNRNGIGLNLPAGICAASERKL